MSMNTITQTHSEKVKAGMAAKAKTGVPTGPLPLGYRKVRRDGIVTVEIDEAAAPLVREAFRLAALKRQSLRKILMTPDIRGLVSKYDKPLSATALWRILTNPFYVGTIIYGNETAAGTHASLVSRKTFDQAQENLMRRKRRPDQGA